MHDRRIDNTTHVFGNHGALWQNAMTWFDHKTGSIWTQPWGRALAGDLKGTQLKIIPFSLVPWETWKAEHPDTIALFSNDYFYGDEFAINHWVVGLAFGDESRAYPYDILVEQSVVNDTLNGIPIVIHTNSNARNVHVFIRQLANGTVLEFTGDDDTLSDTLTGSDWNPNNGLARDGELAGVGLREIPYISSFPRDWRVFYPKTDFYE